MARRADRWRLQPLSRHFGGDRGTPIDRFFIDRFLADHADDIRGRVLEFGDNIYTLKHGGRGVSRSDVLYPKAGKPGVTIVDDLAVGSRIPQGAFDCIVCTQTMQYLFDLRAAVRVLHRSLKPGGVLLATFPGIAQLDSGGAQQGWVDYWRPTRHAVARLFTEAFGEANVAVVAHGNALLAKGFLTGLTVHELPMAAFEHRDDSYDVSITVRATKGDGPSRRVRSHPAAGLLPASGHFAMRQGDPGQPASYTSRSVTVSRDMCWTDGPVARARGTLLADEWGFVTGVDALVEGRAREAGLMARRIVPHMAGPYYVQACRLETVLQPDTAPPLSCGLLETACLHEGLLESLARSLGEDGLELRHRNALRYGLPTASGQWLSSSAGLRPCLDALRPAYTRLAAKRRPGGKRRDGVGIACMAFGIGEAFADMTGRVTLRLAGRRIRLEAAPTNPLLSQLLKSIVAKTLKIPAAMVVSTAKGVEDAADNLFVLGRAGMLAARDLESRMRDRSGAPEEAVLAWDDAGPCFGLGEQVWRPSSGVEDIVGTGSFTPATTGPDADGRGTPYPVYGFAAAVVAITVDTGTGRVAMREISVAADVGRVIAAAAQCRKIRESATSAVARMLVDAPPRMPAVACHLIEDAEPRAALGAKWSGEGAGIVVAPALANALHDARGLALERFPARPDAIAAALRRKER